MTVTKKIPKAESTEILTEETHYIRAPVSLSTYRALVKLSADAQPFTRFNEFCAAILTSFVNHQTNNKTKGKKG